MDPGSLKVDGNFCFSGCQLLQIKERAGGQRKLGLVCWRKIPLSMETFFANCDDLLSIRSCFSMWMDENEIRACCPRVLTEFLAGETTRERRQWTYEGDEEEQAMVETMRADVVSLVERCRSALQKTKRGMPFQNKAAVLLDNNTAILAAYAKVPELSTCLLKSGIVDLLADVMLLKYREYAAHKNSGQALRSLVKHPCIDSTEVILKLLDSIRQLMDESENPNDARSHFEELTLTIMELFASTVNEDCCHTLEEVSYTEVPGRIVYRLLEKYLKFLQLIETRGATCCTGSLTERFEVAMLFADLMGDLFAVMGWSSDLLKGNEVSHSKQGAISIFTGLIGNPSQPVNPLDKYKTRKDFSSDQEYGHYMKSVLKEGMWVRAKSSYDVIAAGDRGKFRCSNSRTPPAQFEWEGLGGDPYWIHWHMVELIVSENEADKKQSPSTGIVKKRHPYGLNVTGNRGSTVQRTDWWEVLYYVKRLDSADLNRLLLMLSSYKVKTFDDLIEILPSVQEANQVIRHLRQHHPLLMSEPLVAEDSSSIDHQPRPQNECSNSADQVIIKPCPPLSDPCPNADTTSTWGVTRTSHHEPSHLGRGYSSSCVEISFGPEHADTSSDQEDDEITISNSVTMTTASDVVEPVSNNNKTDDNTSSNDALLRRSSRIAVMPKKSFADIVSGKVHEHSTTGSTSSQTAKKKKKKKKKSLDYSALEMRVNLASSHMLSDYGRFCVTVDEVLKSITGEKPQRYRTIARCLTLMQNGLQNRSGRLLVEDALAGGFKTILHAMKKGSHSAHVQRLGITCFYNQMGRCSYGYSVTNIPCDQHRREERNSIMAIVSSLVSGQEHGGLRTLVDGLYCAANQYNKEMSDAEKRTSVEAVNHGLVVLANVLHSDWTLLNKMADWQLPKCLEVIRNEFPVFPGKEQLMGIMNRFSISNNSPPLPDENYCQEISSLLQQLDENTCQSAVFQLLGKIGGRSLFDGNASLVIPPEIFVRSILHYRGIAKLVNLLEKSRSLSPSVCSDIVVIIGCVVKAGNQSCSEVILQGGFRGIVSVLNQSGESRRLQLLAIQVLHKIWESSEDNRSATKTKLFDNCLTMLLERYEKDEEVMMLLRELRGTSPDVEDMSTVTQKVLVGVLAGTVQLIIQHVNDCRRYQDHVMLPRLATLVQYMSSVHSGLIGTQEQCWDRVEVSSGSFRKDQLTDGNKHTYWESSGHTGSHWIRVYIKKNIVIKSLAISVNSSDSSYLPHKVAIEGGNSVDHMTVLANVTVEANTTGDVNLLGNLRKHYPIITIKIKKCSQGGIDTRVHGLTVTGSEFNPMWSVFGEVLSTATGIFYNMLTYTWSQEPTQPDLLDLFDRLSDRVAYEQSFADMYLQTTVAKESLGQACHQYLIQPMAKQFTQKGGDKKLSGLIGCYLQRMYCPSLETIFPVADDDTSSCDYVLSAEDWVSMSRIRCMCRLLVDCSSFTSTGSSASSKQKSSKKEPAPSLTTNSSSDALVQCWKDTVKHHVEQTLSVVLAESKPHTVATGLLNIYNKLKCAMRELFGGHSRYAIALKEGFAEQLQALSEPHSVQFCQSFCLSIDSLLNVNGPDRHQLSATMETERETILSQLAEPLQFIHNLDLSHVFEHYYRCHLSVRILNGWSISLPMERRLVQMFTHCFPHKYPMLMLADLDQSKQLMDKFCDSELLEGFDMVLAGSRLRAPQRRSFVMPADVTGLAQKCSFYKQHTLQVYTLTPCYWPLNYQPLPPLQTLPQPLQQFCTDYQSYFCSATRDEEQVRNKKLEWTVYGSGCLSYNKLRLMVSTAQMIVLLQYNKSEVYKFHSLQASTHLGEELLSLTLLALTSEPQNILVAIPPSQDGVYSPDTTFKLNHQFTSQVAKQRNPQQCIWIHSGQYTSGYHSNRQVDLAHLFERRRNIMDAAIVRLLKRDREVSTDTIASYVIKGCSIGQFEGGPPFERFDCDSRDVCFRIDRLILDGYLHRCSVKPHVILYQPSTMELLPSSSQPGSHDPRRAVSISRKRPLTTSSKAPVARTKKRSVECTSHSHIVTKTMTNSSLTFEDVQSLIVSMVTRISEVTKLPADQVELLLRRHQWSEDAVMQEYISLGDEILTEVGLAKTKASSSAITPGNCRVCLNDVSNIMRLSCGHELCQSCCKQYLTTRLSQSVPLDTTCPILSCKQPVTRSTFQQLLTPEVMGQYELAVVKSYVEMSKWFTWCHNPQGCGMALRKADGSQSGTCNKCHWSSCFNCTFIEAHEPASCKDITQWMEAGGFYEGMGEDAKSKQLSKMISKLCPGCSAPIEKNEGCLHMKCKCGCDFCWRCLKPWKPSHTDYFSCSAKESKAAQDVKKFVDYNQRCSQHHTSYGFARRLCQLVNSITEPVNMNHLSFIIDACELLAKCHKLLAYASVSEFFRNKRVVDAFSFLTEDLEGDTNALQAFLENTLLSTTSGVANYISKLPERQLIDGYRLLNKINSTRDKLSIGADQLRFGVVTEEPSAEVIPSRLVGTTSTVTEVWYNSDEDNNNMFDDEPYSSSERYDDSPYYYGSPYYDSDCYSF